MDLYLSIYNGFVSYKIYVKRDDFDFDIVNFPFLDGDIPNRSSYGVYISQLIGFARLCSHVTDFDFDIVNFPFLDGDVPRRPSYGVYISQLIRFAGVYSHVDD